MTITNFCIETSPSQKFRYFFRISPKKTFRIGCKPFRLLESPTFSRGCHDNSSSAGGHPADWRYTQDGDSSFGVGSVVVSDISAMINCC